MLPFIVMAQDYNPLVKEGGVWREAIVRLVNPPDQFEVTKIQYSIMGDTIIDNIFYKKIYSMDYDSLVNNLQYMGAIREDSMQRVFALLVPNSPVFPNDIINDSIETLIYDFNLMLGDTFFVKGMSDSIQIVNNIDSVQIEGFWRKRISFSSVGLSTRVWIEGIGDMKGLFFPALYEFENRNTLTCYEDSEIFWTNPELVQHGTNCFSVGIKRKMPKTNFSLQVYPNPASTIIYFDFKNSFSKPITVTIYNLLGQQETEVVSLTTQKTISINLNNLKKGVYFYKSLSNSKIIGSGKFIKI
jgi:hypothetical protein